jgi:RNA polymerase-binding transcription factor DksA
MQVVKDKKLSKKEKAQVKDFQQKWKEHKEQYIKDHTLEEMVYENGSALAVMYKELQRLSSLVLTQINKENYGKEDSNSK